MLGEIAGRRRDTDEMLDGITNSMNISVRKIWEIVKDRRVGMLPSMGLQRVRHN